jgi:prepilin-type N-terminal cleavage/methylation domain-containing protein
MRLGYGGFTLIETMLVVVLLAILAAAVLLQSPIERVRLNGAAEKVKSDIRYARKLAVSAQERAGVTFNADGYSVYRDVVSSTLANGTSDSCSTDASGKFVVDFTASRCSELGGITLGYSSDTVAFDSLGRPVDDTGVPFAAQQTVTVTGSAGTKTLTIQVQTGRVSE